MNQYRTYKETHDKVIKDMTLHKAVGMLSLFDKCINVLECDTHARMHSWYERLCHLAAARFAQLRHTLMKEAAQFPPFGVQVQETVLGKQKLTEGPESYHNSDT